MKSKGYIVHFIFSLILLTSIGLQSIHNYEHYSITISERHCHHKTKENPQLTHQHHSFDSCSVCTISLTNFIGTVFTKISLKIAEDKIVHEFGYTQKFIWFSRNTILGRGPPAHLF